MRTCPFSLAGVFVVNTSETRSLTGCAAGRRRMTSVIRSVPDNVMEYDQERTHVLRQQIS
jgi:hypothetical protein